MGQQGREKSLHQEEWPKRESLTPGQKNVVHPSLVNSNMIILPSLHTKFGLFKNFIKALDKNVAGFHYLKEKFPPMILESKKEFLCVPK